MGWTRVTLCPIYLGPASDGGKNAGKFQPEFPSRLSAYFRSHDGYERDKNYGKKITKNWYFMPLQGSVGCKVKIRFIGPAFHLVGKNKCRNDYVEITQWDGGSWEEIVPRK